MAPFLSSFYAQVNCVRLLMFELFFIKLSEGIMNAKKAIEFKITVLNDSPKKETFTCKQCTFPSFPTPHIQN